MSLLCFFGRHRPSTSSLTRSKSGRLRATCERCSLPVEQNARGRFRASDPIYEREDVL